MSTPTKVGTAILKAVPPKTRTSPPPPPPPLVSDCETGDSLTLRDRVECRPEASTIGNRKMMRRR